MQTSDVRFIAVHCSASRPSMDIDWHEIDRWHRQRGFLKIGYHYVIRRDGTIEQTSRAPDEAGAHVEGFNHCSLGICLVGGVAEDGKTAEDNFTADQKQSLAQLILELRQEGYAKAEVLGHRDFPNVAKDCPSFDVRAWMKSVGL